MFGLRGSALISGAAGADHYAGPGNNCWDAANDSARNIPRYIVKSDGIVYDVTVPGGRGGAGPSAMKNGTVKFFNSKVKVTDKEITDMI